MKKYRYVSQRPAVRGARDERKWKCENLWKAMCVWSAAAGRTGAWYPRHLGAIAEDLRDDVEALGLAACHAEAVRRAKWGIHQGARKPEVTDDGLVWHANVQTSLRRTLKGWEVTISAPHVEREFAANAVWRCLHPRHARK